MREVVVLTGIGRKNQRDHAILRRHLAQPVARSHAVDHRRHPPRISPVCKARELQVGVARAGLLEADHSGKQTPVHLGQHDMHRQIRRRKPALCRSPFLATGGRKRHLPDRAPCGIEGRDPGLALG